jgi:hypothetical protein
MKRILVTAAAAILAACASAPSAVYEAAADLNSPGYLVIPNDDGRYTVAYTGARGMTRAQVAEYALLRAAEFTLEQGQEWFAVIDTKTQNVQLIPNDDLKARAGGGFVAGESTTAGAGGGAAAPGPAGTSDPMVAGGPRTGGFGGGDVPYQVLERWTPPTVPQTVLIIQTGSGDQAAFEGLDKPPQIFGARTLADEIRSKMTQ